MSSHRSRRPRLTWSRVGLYPSPRHPCENVTLPSKLAFDQPEPIQSFEQLQKLEDSYRDERDRWIFRGLSSAEQDLRDELAPSMDRAFVRLGLIRNDSENGALKWEDRLLREFQRHFFRYSHRTPKLEDRVEWLAIMRHYGAPTRLLDWTYSFWVGVFFAMDRAKVGKEAVLWALPLDQWHALLNRTRPSLVERIRKIAPTPDLSLEDVKRRQHDIILYEDNKQGVWPVNPFFLNERLAAQQGLFLLPTDLRQSFVENLAEMQDSANGSPHLRRMPILLDRDNLAAVYRHLFRINVTKTTLFPGLEGFAEHLAFRLVMPEHFRGAEAL